MHPGEKVRLVVKAHDDIGDAIPTPVIHDDQLVVPCNWRTWTGGGMRLPCDTDWSRPASSFEYVEDSLAGLARLFEKGFRSVDEVTSVYEFLVPQGAPGGRLYLPELEVSDSAGNIVRLEAIGSQYRLSSATDGAVLSPEQRPVQKPELKIVRTGQEPPADLNAPVVVRAWFARTVQKYKESQTLYFEVADESPLAPALDVFLNGDTIFHEKMTMVEKNIYSVELTSLPQKGRALLTGLRVYDEVGNFLDATVENGKLPAGIGYLLAE